MHEHMHTLMPSQPTTTTPTTMWTSLRRLELAVMGQGLLGGNDQHEKNQLF